MALESPEGLSGGIGRLTAHPQRTAVPPEAAVGLELVFAQDFNGERMIHHVYCDHFRQPGTWRP